MAIEFTLNGEQLRADVPGDTTLLRFLRDVECLRGTKNGCSQNHCGACMVLLDDRAVKSCLLKLTKVAGRRVETIEGMAPAGELHPIQAAFLAAGAVQCGFCTPGMVVATKALLLDNPTPSEEQIKEALADNICRCTGYVKIIDAVRLAARWLAHPKEMAGGKQHATPAGGVSRPVPGHKAAVAQRRGGLGESVADLDGVAKTQGTLAFADDLYPDGVLFGKVVWSAHRHAEIVKVDTERARSAPGVAGVLTAADVPGNNGMGSLKPDQPVLCGRRVRYLGDAVAAVFADSEAAAAAAATLVRVEYRVLPGIYSPARGLEPDAPLLHESGNLCKHLVHEEGDVAAGLASAAVVVEGHFETPFVEHAYLEPEAAVALPEADGGVTVYAPTQFPFELRRQLAAALALGEEQVRVVATPLGGAFGSKLDNTVEALVALAAARLGRPSKLTFTREESIRVSTKRHAYSMDYRVGVDGEGRLLSVDARLLSDAGPYTALSPRVIDQACLFSCGPYRVPNLRVEGWAVHTNNANASAFRGFGINQVAVAIESLLDEAAQQLGIDPFEVRLRNALRIGDRTISGEILQASVTTAQTIEKAAQALRRDLPWLAEARALGRRIGVGVASGFKNVGAGKGKVDDAGAIFELRPDGRILLRASAVDMGQGIRTTLLQIAREVLDVDLDLFDLVTGDTARTIRHGGAVGERQTLISGKAVELAAREFQVKLIERAAAVVGRSPEELRIEGGAVRGAERAGTESHEIALGLDELAEELSTSGETLEVSYYYVAPKTYALADAEARRTVPPSEYRNYPAYAYATQVAIVEVEPTGEVRVLKIIAAHDCGRAVNPQKIEGQIEGSCLQGMGYALSEAYRLEEGRPLTRTYRQLRVPGISDTPEIECLLIEDPEPNGPFGAKGISEVATVPVTPAILNAIYDATGVRIREIPADPTLIRTGINREPHHWWAP